MVNRSEAGTLWIYYGKSGNRRSALEQLELPEIRDLRLAKPNDCVMIVGECEGGAVGSMNPIVSSVSPWLMNAAASRVASLPREELERRLRREGLPARFGAGKRDGTPISVSVWGRAAIEMRRVFPNAKKFNDVKYKRNLWDKSEITSEHAIWKPAEKLSVRALYLLGLDYGQVDLLLTEGGKLTITGVSPFLKEVKEEVIPTLQELIREFSSVWAEETTNGVRAKLGADPEFVLLSPEGRVVPATRYFTPEGDTGADSVRIRGEKRWPLVELRPRPTLYPESLTSDVRRLLQVAAERTIGSSLTWKAGALPVPGLPLGGHVHLSGVALTNERLRALDNALALPLRLLEPREAARRRPRYGFLGDARSQSHGGFEYRTPPSWLVSPRLALGAFALAKVAAEHSRELASDRPLDEERYRDAFYQGDRTLLLVAMERVRQVLARTNGYLAYREPIDFLFDSIERGRSWDESSDIRLKWRIPIL